jgi:hypothetical protein
MCLCVPWYVCVGVWRSQGSVCLCVCVCAHMFHVLCAVSKDLFVTLRVTLICSLETPLVSSEMSRHKKD